MPMNQPRIEECGERSVYTCMLWNVRSRQPTVVTVHDEHHDRWIGRRCTVASSSFEAPLEMFMKTDWQRAEPTEPEVISAADMHKRPRGFHP